MLCHEELSDFSPDVDQAVRSLNESQNPPHSLETRCVVKDAFDAAMAKGSPHSKLCDVVPNDFGPWVDSVSQFVNMMRCDSRCVHHTLTLFLKYTHSLTRIQWNSLYWHRLACLWIAIKYTNSDFDEIHLFVVKPGAKRSLIAAEIDVMRGVNYEMAAPPDYMYMLGVLLEVPPSIMIIASTFFDTLLKTPLLWVGVPHVLVCAACIVAACEDQNGPTTTEMLTPKIVELGVADTRTLLSFSEKVLLHN